MDAILAAVGLSKGATVGGFLGALVSLKFIEGLNLWQGASTVASGMLLAGYGGPLATIFLKLTDKQEGAVAFLIGVFGMALSAALVKAIPGFVEAARERIKGST